MKFLQGLLIVACTLVFLECSARGVVTVLADIEPEPTTWFMYSDELGWGKRPGFIGIMEEKDISIGREKLRREFDSQGFSGEDSAQIADRRVPKVITVGDSSTLGYGVPADRTYAEQLDAMLPDMHVVNLGVSGYTSYQGLRTLEKYMPVLNPALIIVSFNFNDRRYVLSPDDMDNEAKFTRDMAGRRVGTIQQKVYTYRVIRRLMLKVGILRDVDHSEKAAVDDLRTLNVRVPPNKYRENLAKMADMAKAQNIPIIFLVLHDNPMPTQHLNRGLEFLEKSQYDMAAREFMIVAHNFKWYSGLAKKYLAEVYEKSNGLIGDVKEIVRIREGESSVHGGVPLYRDDEYHEIMTSVAREYAVTLVDAGPALEPSVYLDHVHPDERGHKAIATLLYAAIKDLRTKS